MKTNLLVKFPNKSFYVQGNIKPNNQEINTSKSLKADYLGFFYLMNIKFIMDKVPKTMMINPETLLTHESMFVLNLSFNKPTIILSVSHQKAEPTNTPITKYNAEKLSPIEFSMPKPANTPKKDMMVIGLEMVNKKTEKYDVNNVLPFAFADSLAGLERNI